MLKIYTDLSLLPLGFPVDLLIPFIGKFNAEDNDGKMMSTRFDDYIKNGKDYISLTSIEESDVCLLPIAYELREDKKKNFENSIQAFIDKVKLSKKKTLVFLGHDIPSCKIKIPNAIIFNSAINKSSQQKNVFAYPHFFEDYISVYKNNNISIREKFETPTVGFCGYAPPLNLKWGKAKITGDIKLIANYCGIMKYFPSKSSHSYRARTLLGLKRAKNVNPNFKIKGNFAWGPQGIMNTGASTETDSEFRTNYVDNILNSDYTLCVRGIGNNSIRFFETMCCSRIPIFVNTDSVLPFDFIIDWKKYCVWVEENEIDRCGKVVAEFHKNVSSEKFKELQVEMRELWEKYFTPIGFFSNLKVFLDQVDNPNGK